MPEGRAAQRRVEEPAVGANSHRQAGRGRQASAGHRHALDEAQRAAFGVHCESEDFLASAFETYAIVRATQSSVQPMPAPILAGEFRGDYSFA